MELNPPLQKEGISKIESYASLRMTVINESINTKFSPFVKGDFS